MFLVITLIATIAIIADLNIYSDLADNIQTAKLDALKNMNLPTDQMEMRIKITKMFTTPTAIVIFAIVGNLVGGAIFSLITAGLCSRRKPIIDETNEMPSGDAPLA